MNEDKIDRPSAADFIKGITDNIPSKEAQNKMLLGIAAYFAYKGYKKSASKK
jgi:hypothetical protein